MPVPFADFGKACDDLFNDHHQSGLVKFTKSGKVGSAGSTYELASQSCINGGKPLEWNLKIDGGNFKVEHDHSGAIKKELNFDVKQVAGLSASWKPAFSQANGLDLGNLNINYAHEKAHLALDLALPTPNSADFELSVAPFTACKAFTLGAKGTLGASGLTNASWGYNLVKGDVNCTFKSNDLTNLLAGQCSLYQNLPNNKYFSSYGMQTDKSSNLALAFSTGCCANGTRFNVNQAGVLNVANVRKINSAASLNVSASVNLANMSEGGHKVGFGLSFE